MNTRKLLRNAVIGSLVILILATGCGKWRKFKEQDLSYKSLIGRTGSVRLYAAGEIVADYPKAQILYSSSDSSALWLKINDKEIYWQGDAFIELD